MPVKSKRNIKITAAVKTLKEGQNNTTDTTDATDGQTEAD